MQFNYKYRIFLFPSTSSLCCWRSIVENNSCCHWTWDFVESAIRDLLIHFGGQEVKETGVDRDITTMAKKQRIKVKQISKHNDVRTLKVQCHRLWASSLLVFACVCVCVFPCVGLCVDGWITFFAAHSRGWRQPLLVVSEEEQFQEEHNSAAFTYRSTSTNVAE